MTVTSSPLIMLVCHQCSTVNRAPASRLLSAGHCGKCKASLATEKPADIDGAALAKLQTRDTGAYVVDVWAPWCGPCRMMAPSYEAAAEKFSDHVRLFKLDSDQNPAAGSSLGIRGVPTLIAFRGGRQIAHQAGAQAGPALTNWLEAVFRTTINDTIRSS